MQWIANLLDRALGSAELGLPCIMRLTQDNVRMELLEYQLPCGHIGYIVNLEFCLDGADNWIPIASLRDFTLNAAIELLGRAQQCVEQYQR